MSNGIRTRARERRPMPRPDGLLIEPSRWITVGGKDLWLTIYLCGFPRRFSRGSSRISLSRTKVAGFGRTIHKNIYTDQNAGWLRLRLTLHTERRFFSG